MSYTIDGAVFRENADCAVFNDLLRAFYHRLKEHARGTALNSMELSMTFAVGYFISSIIRI